MKRKQYIRYMAFLERSKSSGSRSKYKVIRAYRHYKYTLISFLENVLIKSMSAEECCLTNNSYRKEKVIASLTTFPARIKEVRYAIMSIMLQTEQPDKIILWLADTQFPNNAIPNEVSDLCDKGLEVRFCDDLRSHKKYFYALQEQQPDEVVITFDDDIIYHPHTIERLLETHLNNHKCVICSLAHIITYNAEGNINPYQKWKTTIDYMDKPNKDYSPLTGGGCLYPYGIMCNETFNKERIITLAFTADDLWIAFMCKISHVMICPTRIVSRTFTVTTNTQTYNLSQINNIEEGNNIVLNNMLTEYPLYKNYF